MAAKKKKPNPFAKKAGKPGSDGEVNPATEKKGAKPNPFAKKGG